MAKSSVPDSELSHYHQELIDAIRAQPNGSYWVVEIFSSYIRGDLVGIGHALQHILKSHEPTGDKPDEKV